ncbi:hypothetical protein DFH28DRAFT_981204 [Melampsora americana]|nr:hypothetical protein DFH28DRAFT_981204 [Melampsora americana]
MDDVYNFPTHRLLSLQDDSKTPLVFVACGSFSPVTFLHLRMFEMARDHARVHTEFEVVGGYLSLVNDAYKKPGLAPAIHRYNMCELACEETSDWLMVDPWEARQIEYSPTARVLDHFDHQLNSIGNGVLSVQTGLRKPIRIILLAGSDLIQTMSEPGLWAEEDLHHILSRYGCYIIERAESEIDQSLFSPSSVHSRSPLSLYKHQIYMVPQLVRNDVSSTKVRLFVRKGMSIEYLIPSAVIKYIKTHSLYQDEMSHLSLSSINTPMIESSASPLFKHALESSQTQTPSNLTI